MAPLLTLPLDWLPHRYDPDQDTIHYVRADRATRAGAMFLIDAHLPGAGEPLVVPREEALALAGGRDRLGFVFNSAYCCSTLVANAYERPGVSYPLKEPVLLNDLAGWRHRGAPPDAVGARLRDALTLLARPFAAGEVGIVKPSNVVNALAAAMIATRPEAGVLLIHAPLKLFLGSVARKGLSGRLWVRDLLAKQITDGLIPFGFAAKDYLLQSDLQVAAVGWLAQHALFAGLAQRWPDRVRTLDSETLVARPREALAALDALFGVQSDDAARDAVVTRVFRRHAKFGDAFAEDDRRADQDAAAAAHGAEIEAVARWSHALAAQAGVTLDLPQPLLGA